MKFARISPLKRIAEENHQLGGKGKKKRIAQNIPMFINNTYLQY